ncbi:MAG: SDR family NAD(P)-dependent oxidoreductase [Chloroflexota bacterium]
MTANSNVDTILITGATDGIGLALARLYHPIAKQLILVGRRPLEETALSDLSSILYCQVDLGEDNCADYIADFLHENHIGTIDLLIHNAGTGYYGDTGEQSADSIERLVAVNVWAPISITHRVLPKIKKVRGKIVFISSVVSVVPTPDYAVYGATKAALDGFARNLRLELGNEAQVQVIHPGGTRTGMHQKSGITRDVFDWEKFPSAGDVARDMVRVMAGNNRSVALGLGNRALRFGGKHFGGLIHLLMQRRYQQPTNQHSTNVQAKHCVITGAADGIGKALIIRFAQAGYVVTGIDVDQYKAETLRAELERQGYDVAFFVSDLTQKSEITSLTQSLSDRPQIDVFIHNAGINAVGHFAEMGLHPQYNVLRLNFLAPLLLTASLLKNRAFTTAPYLIFVSSLSYFVGYPGATVYAASKDGLAAYARSLGIITVKNPGRTLTVFPGPTRTAHARRYSPDNSREAKRMLPETLANLIFTAAQNQRQTLIPGFGNKAFAYFGKFLPKIAEKVMKRVILEALPRR